MSQLIVPGDAVASDVRAGKKFSAGANYNAVGALNVRAGYIWTLTAAATGIPFNALVGGNGVFLAGAAGSNGLYGSFDGGSSFGTASSPTGGSPVTALAFGNGLFVVASANGAIYSGTDGFSWVTNLAPGGVSYTALGAGANYQTGGMMYIAMGNNSSYRSSKDAIAWTNTAGGISGNWKSVAYLPGTGCGFVASDGSNRIAYNGTGAGNFTSYSLPIGVFALVAGGIGYYMRRVVAVGPSGFAYTSAPNSAANWAMVASPPSGSYNAVCWANGLFVAVGDAGAIATSPDGVNWTKQTVGTENFTVVAGHDGGTFIAATSTGSVYTSMGAY